MTRAAAQRRALCAAGGEGAALAAEARAASAAAHPGPAGDGAPAEGYPWPWSVYRWLDGETATIERIADLEAFAIDLADFLVALQADRRRRRAAARAAQLLPRRPAGRLRRRNEAGDRNAGRQDRHATPRPKFGSAALAATWQGPPVWVHGDVASGNLLVRDGRLSAVIDFGTSGVGDPACDLYIAWTLLEGESREAFRAALPLDDATWARGRGWTLWKALITLARHIDTDPRQARVARRVIDEVLADHKRKA